MKKKLLIIVVIIGILGSMTLFDVIRSTHFKVEILSMNPQPAKADGRSPVTIKVRVLHNNDPVQGHDIYAVPQNGGSFKAFRVKSDEKGIAEFCYYPYKVSAVRKLVDVKFEFVDQSNSVFMEIPVKASTTLKMVDPGDTGEKSKYDLDNIFGEESDSENTQTKEGSNE